MLAVSWGPLYQHRGNELCTAEQKAAWHCAPKSHSDQVPVHRWFYKHRPGVISLHSVAPRPLRMRLYSAKLLLCVLLHGSVLFCDTRLVPHRLTEADNKQSMSFCSTWPCGPPTPNSTQQHQVAGSQQGKYHCLQKSLKESKRQLSYSIWTIHIYLMQKTIGPIHPVSHCFIQTLQGLQASTDHTFLIAKQCKKEGE